MIETVLSYIGLWTVIVGVIYILPITPLVGVVVVGYPMKRVQHALEGVYYEDTDDVQKAKESGAWHFHVTHNMTYTRNKLVEFADWYSRYMDIYYSALPLTTI